MFKFGLVAFAAVAAAELPKVDFGKMGSVGVGGSYDGLDFWSPPKFSSRADVVVSGNMDVLGMAGEGGTVHAVCTEGEKVYIGGEFTSFNGTSAVNIVSFDLSSGAFAAMGGGLDGRVDVLHCSEGEVWAAGNFTQGVAVWSSSWSSPFTLQGVKSISPSPRGLFFAGDFTTRVNTTNNATSSAPEGTTVSGLSGYLTPLALSNATITAGPALSGNASTLLCPGSDTNWLARDGSEAQINVLAYKSLRASGIRLGNSLENGRGTTSFRIISIPDNTQLTLSYAGADGNQTCSDSCPLSTDPDVTAQDFLFPSRDLTGFQIILSSWQGDGAGLSRMQLLSEGAYASASGDTGCGVSSSVETAGLWEPCTVPTGIPGTTADVLYANIPVDNTTSPSVTFYPYIASSGTYDVYLMTPGCNRLLDCDGRTSVDVEVFPTDGGLGWTSTISQKVEQDTSSLIYSGYMEASSGNFSATIILTLAANPEQVQGSTYVVVADQVTLTLTGINGTANSNSSASTGFGIFEWPESNNSDVTTLSRALRSANATSVNAVVAYDSAIYVGGSFGNYSNVVGVDQGIITLGGLDGPVYAAARLGSYLYFGGDFNKPADGGVTLDNLARYDPAAKAWAAIGGTNGVVTEIIISSEQLVIIGNFTSVSYNGATTKTGGRAVWDTSTSQWTTEGLIFGTLSAAAVGQDTYLAGRISGYTANPVSSFAYLSDNTIKSANVDFGTEAALRKRSGWLSLVTEIIAKRRLDDRAVASSSATAPAVLAGAYYSNSSVDITILGGNFSANGSAVAFYPGEIASPVTGVVRALAVYQDTLFIGGSDVQAVDSGLLVYNLASNQWVTGRVPALNGDVVIHAIRNRKDTSALIVAGSFTSAGSLSCPGICLWDQESAQWNALGSGLSGEVRAIDFAGTDILIAAGEFTIDGNQAYAAEYSFTNNLWRALGSLPGPAAALAVDDNNANNIFISGDSYLSQWNGSEWNTTNLPGSASQLAFVPMSDEHSAEGAIEKDRMLMVSGDLALEAGNASTALYDGAQWYPYLIASSETGAASAAGFYWSQQSFSFALRRYLAKGIVVLIAIAIATGLIFLLVLLGILIAFCFRRREEPFQEKHNDTDVLHAAVQRSFEPKESDEYTLGDEALLEGRETIMRYDFKGDEEQPGELTVSAGDRIIIIDDVQSPEWSYVRVVSDGREGVVPSSYVW